jgi:hypothetical protein
LRGFGAGLHTRRHGGVVPLSRDCSRTAERIGTDPLTINREFVDNLFLVIPEIDISRVAQLMLKRYGEDAELESAKRADELAEAGDHDGAVVWRRVVGCGRSAREHDTAGDGALKGCSRLRQRLSSATVRLLLGYRPQDETQDNNQPA